MVYPPSAYIEARDGGLYITRTRVSHDSVVIRFQQGASPEKIVQPFPTLKLSLVYGAIAYYLENESIIGEYIAEGEREFDGFAVPLSQTNPELFARLEAARRQTGLKRVKVRFLADEDLDADIVHGLRSREPAIDILDVKTAGPRGRADPDLLHLAAQQGRILITDDRRTMTRHFRNRLAAGESSHPGLFVVPQCVN